MVHNSDGVNPYAAELASLLCRDGAPVTLVDAANSDSRPAAGVRWRRLLPKNFSHASPAAQVVALVRGLAATVAGSVLHGQVVLVAFTRFPAEDLVLAALAAAGRPVVLVVHNPVPREHESAPARFARRTLLTRALVVVIHAERLRGRLDTARRGPVVVCPHPPYLEVAPSGAADVVLDPTRSWVAFIGALRWDKGAGLLPEILAHVPEARRRGLGLVVCGRGSLPDAAWAAIRTSGVEVCDLTSAEPVPQDLLLEVLRHRPLVLAPYVAATQSGSVILALSLGCRVLAFDEGGIPDVLTADGLVPTGDVGAMGRAIGEGRGGTAVDEVPRWAEHAARSWTDVVQRAAASG
ncbi:hypothetical protein N866_12145 [Actinotalea ferrariae CF5-4]|uniref:D-inositol 3-phosphate glycosyltransferase n=1 Tax=Actinotalea ferrariae CF5-4 TaxID=948458 RepID=A0A021VLV6_9CELL|nr:hypothetical protein N866_12145 [Actinotalea ferrariae CF5-4]